MARYSVNGRRIREIRLGKSIGSKDLAARAGVSERTLLEIEEGKRQATEETLFSVCRQLEVDPGTVLMEEADGKKTA